MKTIKNIPAQETAQIRRSMCEFCEKIYKTCDNNMGPQIVYGNYCSNESDMYYISIITDDGLEYTVDNIRFCPICGRDLRSVENE